eukprot:CAMPEP_0172444710 /NCGR_PEP_ID=MMETSP1065-20121228/4715_1 /TAXON_ID=265537 /ORGANISM="Amphiprora paludosa, Strain CCMP125" /LENGTH=709 /DNA_ID=CAMNT_0013195355 /DNA_START=80 /DNA_END=2209 /DNA_ORIENTATION=+
MAPLSYSQPASASAANSRKESASFNSSQQIAPKMTGTSWVWLVSMLMVACLAGSMDWKMQRHIESMTSSVQSALRMAVFDLMENLEGYELEMKAHQEEEQAHSLEHLVDQLDEKSEYEHSYAHQTRLRGEYLAKLAIMDERKGEDLLDRAHHNEALRQQVLANLTIEEKEHQETENHILAIHQGMCNWTLLSKVCDTVGGVTGLSQRADQEALQIQAEWRQVKALEKQEKLQQMVAHMLQGKAGKFQETSQNLLHVADLWDAHAQQAYDQVARNASHAADVLEQDAQQLEQEADEAHDLQVLADLEAHKLLHAAELEHVKAYWCAIVALLAASVATLYFMTLVAPRIVELCEATWFGSDRQYDLSHTQAWQPRDWHNLCYYGLHFLFFGMIVGMTGYYFAALAQYTVAQRAVIVVWFAFLGSTFQTFFLHAIPRFLVEVRSLEPDLRGFVVELVVKGVLLFLLYGMEVLMSCIIWGPTGGLLSRPLIGFFNSLLYCLVVVLAALAYGFYFDHEMQQEQCFVRATMGHENETVWRCSNTEQSTLLSSNNNNTQGDISEFTPLNKEDILSSGTTLDVHRYDGGEDPSNPQAPSDMGTSVNASTIPTTTTISASEWSCLKEFHQLWLPFEMLIITAMVAVLRNCFHTVWNSQATLLQCAVFVCAAALLMLGGVLVKDLTCCEECYGNDAVSVNKQKSRRTGKRLDAVELVQV